MNLEGGPQKFEPGSLYIYKLKEKAEQSAIEETIRK